MSRSTPEHQAAPVLLDRARPAAPKPRAKAGLPRPLRVTDPRSASNDISRCPSLLVYLSDQRKWHPMKANVEFSEGRELPLDQVLELYRANQWSSAEKPELLHRALHASHSLVSAWDGSRLVGVGNAISDGCLVVYYPHLLVLPEYQGRGIGRRLMEMLLKRYEGFHQHTLLADGRAIEFYHKCGFERAGRTEPMWIYAGQDH